MSTGQLAVGAAVLAGVSFGLPGGHWVAAMRARTPRRAWLVRVAWLHTGFAAAVLGQVLALAGAMAWPDPAGWLLAGAGGPALLCWACWARRAHLPMVAELAEKTPSRRCVRVHGGEPVTGRGFRRA